MDKNKRESIQCILQQESMDALLITDPFNLRYLSGFRGGEGVLYLSEKQCVLITDSRYTEAAEKETDFTVIEENAGHKRGQILQECMEQDGAGLIGYEDEDLRCRAFSELIEHLPKVKIWKPLGQKVNDLRRIKSPEELACLEKAEAIGDAAFADILQILHAGMTEKEIAAELEYRMKKHGADGLSFSTIVASGVHSSMPHAIPTDKPAESGDFVTMDFGCTWEGYCSDMTRTVVIGKADERQKELYALVQAAQQNCLDHLHAGMTGKEADAFARDLIRDAGYGAQFGHGTGHGVGLFIHENPRISPQDDTVLQENMVETVEPGVYIPGFGGVRIEDMVVITKEGHRNLAHSPKELLEIG